MRHPPSDLYEAVLKLATAIAQPDTSVEGELDLDEAESAMARLTALFDERQALGTPDPFLTETLADFTTDAVEAVRLYRLAIEQSAAFPDEPIYTKRQSLAGRLFEIGRAAEAEKELIQARREAFAAGDSEAVKELSALE